MTDAEIASQLARQLRLMPCYCTKRYGKAEPEMLTIKECRRCTVLRSYDDHVGNPSA